MASMEAPGSKISNVQRLMMELGLKEDDLDDVMFDEKEAPPVEAR